MILHGSDRPDLLIAETLPDILEATILRHPDAVAIHWQDQSITYETLGRRADLAAHHLIEAGVRPGDIVGLCLPRGDELLLMQAAIAKAGAAWLPFESDTRPSACRPACRTPARSTSSPAARSSSTASPPVRPGSCRSRRPARRRCAGVRGCCPSIRPTSSTPPVPLASQGRAHHPGQHLPLPAQRNEVLGVRHGDKVYQGFSVAFDMSFEEIWISYLVGASLWVAPKMLTTDPEGLPEALAREGVTVLHAVPTLLALFSRDVPSLRIINLGGEMCPEFLAARWAAPGRRMYNTYGPTETTVSASLAELLPGQPSPSARRCPTTAC